MDKPKKSSSLNTAAARLKAIYRNYIREALLKNFASPNNIFLSRKLKETGRNCVHPTRNMNFTVMVVAISTPCNSKIKMPPHGMTRPGFFTVVAGRTLVIFTSGDNTRQMNMETRTDYRVATPQNKASRTTLINPHYLKTNAYLRCG